MPQYRITHRHQGDAIISAARFEKNGSGTTFYDENGEQIASFYDGEITNVVRNDVVFSNAAAPAEDPEAGE